MYKTGDEEKEELDSLVNRKEAATKTQRGPKYTSTGTLFCAKGLKHIKKKLYPDNYISLYKAVSVCKSCFLIYSLLSDYLEELIRATSKKAPKPYDHSQPQKKWVHSEQLLKRN